MSGPSRRPQKCRLPYRQIRGTSWIRDSSVSRASSLTLPGRMSPRSSTSLSSEICRRPPATAAAYSRGLCMQRLGNCHSSSSTGLRSKTAWDLVWVALKIPDQHRQVCLQYEVSALSRTQGWHQQYLTPLWPCGSHQQQGDHHHQQDDQHLLPDEEAPQQGGPPSSPHQVHDSQHPYPCIRQSDG